MSSKSRSRRTSTSNTSTSWRRVPPCCIRGPRPPLSIHDMHGERAAGAAEGPAEESFDKQNRRQANGSLTAPFTGIHGWYWENPGAETITVRLTSAGYYTSAVEIRSDRTRRHALPQTARDSDTARGDVRRS